MARRKLKAGEMPEPGDMALHKKGNLDARPVARVSPEGRTIRLRIGAITSDEVPASNYTFTREEF